MGDGNSSRIGSRSGEARRDKNSSTCNRKYAARANDKGHRDFESSKEARAQKQYPLRCPPTPEPPCCIWTHISAAIGEPFLIEPPRYAWARVDREHAFTFDSTTASTPVVARGEIPHICWMEANSTAAESSSLLPRASPSRRRCYCRSCGRWYRCRSSCGHYH